MPPATEGAATTATPLLRPRATAHVCSVRNSSVPPWRTFSRRSHASHGQGVSDAPYCHRASVPTVKPPLPADTKISDCLQKPHDKVTQCSQASLALTPVRGE